MDFDTHVRRSTVTTVKKSDKKRFQSNRKVKRLCFPNMAKRKNCERKEMIFKALAKVFKAKLFLGNIS